MNSEAQLKENPNFQPSDFFLFLIGVCLPLQIFALLAAAIVQNGEGLPWDVAFLSAIHDTANLTLDRFAYILTQFGYVKGIIPVVLLISFLLFRRKQWYRFAYLLINTSSSLLICYTAKLLFHRVRPHLWDLFHPLPSDYSFPSGHSFLSMMLLVSLVHLTWGSRWCKWVMIMGGIFVVGIGWTRLYLGVHYPSDVLAGWMLAVAWGILVNLSLKFLLDKLIAKEQRYP